MSGFADLHRHLDGSLRKSTLLELADRNGMQVPRDLAFRKGIGLEAALERFALVLSLIQNPREVERVAAEICEDALRDGVTTLEIRFAPQLHCGAPMEEIVDAATSGVAGRAGLILCGLYGEPPELLNRLVSCASTRKSVVGIDIAGSPAMMNFPIEEYTPAFKRAADIGLGRTVHSGEGRPAMEIANAVRALRPNRLGHATTLLDDSKLVDTVLAQGIVVEACVTSNVHTGAVSEAELHPLPKWAARGIRVCICTDNTLLSDTNAQAENEQAARLVSTDELNRMIETGHAAAFRR
ncbi:MAG: amidohydrolase family protein [Deltaproteobacteria bacterium]|nr:amidohydrolase family protein [Deltaproteobacteria bacterium]